MEVSTQYEALRPVAFAAPVAVLHIIKSLGRGGAEMLLPETLRHHDQMQYRFHYMYFLPWKDQLVNEIEQAGGTVVCLPAQGNMGILWQVRRIAAYIKRHNIQFVHCHMPWAGVVGRIAGALTGVPVVYTEHNKWERYHTLTYYANKFSFSRQKKVIAVSAEVAHSIKRNYGKELPQVTVVSNGIDTGRFWRHWSAARDIRKELHISPTATVIGTVCVFRSQKRLDIWLQIAARLHAIYPELFFLVVGDGVLRKEIHEKATQLATASYVHFAGMQTDTRSYLYAMDIFMMTSQFEGLPIALLEAMSMECLPACTVAGGIPEVIQDGVSGLLAPVNDPMALVGRIGACLLQPAKMNAMKRAARETVVNHFGMQKMVNALESIYHELLTAKT